MPEAVSQSARTELLLAVAHCGIDSDGPQYRAWAADALRLAREMGNRDAEAQALANLAMIEAGRSQVATSDSEAFRLLTQAREIARQASAYHPTIKLVIFETHLLCGAGEFEPAARAARRGIADAERHGLARTGGAFLAINLAEPLWYLGRWDEAVQVAGRALDLAPPPRTRVGLWMVDGAIALARGDLATAGRRAAACRAGARRGRLMTSSTTCRLPALTSNWRWPPRARPPPLPWPPRRLRSTTCRCPARGTPGRCW